MFVTHKPQITRTHNLCPNFHFKLEVIRIRFSSNLRRKKKLEKG